MFRSRILASTLVSLVSVPGFLVGQRFKHADHTGALLMLAIMAVVVFAASALMQQSE